MPKILCLITAGPGGQDELRARRLADCVADDVTYYAVDKNKARNSSKREIDSLLKSQAWDLIYQEGTGIAGGLPLIQYARTKHVPYVVSSGDPISGFFRVTKGQAHALVFEVYERLLYKHCAGFIGWTPYLTGRAIHMGACRGATVEGGADLGKFFPPTPLEKRAARAQFGLREDHVVCGVVGSLRWSQRQSYSYGLELVETVKALKRQDVSVLIVGDGTGKEVLEKRVPEALRSRIVFTGRLPQAEVVRAMHAMDIGFITQTLDGLGTYRLTTKLPEYLASGLAVAMSPIPGFYDYVAPAGWALPAAHPGSSEFFAACARWLDLLTADEIAERASRSRSIAEQYFDYAMLSKRFSGFVKDILNSQRN